MRGVQCYIPPLPPSPSPSSAGVDANQLLVSILSALLLPCAGMSLIFIIYICLLWYTARNARNDQNRISDYGEPVKPVAKRGLTESELERLPEVAADELKNVGTTECAVCLEDIETGQPARLLPGCNHGFHQQCADTWLSRNSVCPLCRATIQLKIVIAADDDNHQNPC